MPLEGGSFFFSSRSILKFVVMDSTTTFSLSPQAMQGNEHGTINSNRVKYQDLMFSSPDSKISIWYQRLSFTKEPKFDGAKELERWGFVASEK